MLLVEGFFQFFHSGQGLVSSSLVFAASACCDFTFSCKSEFRASLLLSSTCNIEGIFNKTTYLCTKYKSYNKLSTSYLGANAYLLSNTTFYASLQNNASIILDTWGLMYICSKLVVRIKNRINLPS